MADQYSIRYPRKVALRAFLKKLVRLSLPLLCRVEVNGVSRIPKQGPVILAGNHVAVMEIVFMLAYTPGQVEFVGAGDIPLEPSMRPYAKLYGFLPIRRGMVDRAGMNAARDVLLQGGKLVVFPEGGIWDPAGMNSRLGVAWLSEVTQAPVVPVGFGGTQGALGAMRKFTRPKLTMNVGEPITPLRPVEKNENRRVELEEFAGVIFDRIQSLIPESERSQRPARTNVRYELQVGLIDANRFVDVTSQFKEQQQKAVAHFFCQPVLLDALRRNLKLDVTALQQLDRVTDAQAIAAATSTVLRYLDQNPGFLTYRFGVEEGIDAAEGLIVLFYIANEAAKKQQGVMVGARHRYQLGSDGEEVCEPFGQKIDSKPIKH